MKGKATRVGPRADRDVLTVQVAVSAVDLEWSDAQLAAAQYLGAGQAVGDYLRQIVRCPKSANTSTPAPANASPSSPNHDLIRIDLA